MRLGGLSFGLAGNLLHLCSFPLLCPNTTRTPPRTRARIHTFTFSLSLSLALSPFLSLPHSFVVLALSPTQSYTHTHKYTLIQTQRCIHVHTCTHTKTHSPKLSHNCLTTPRFESQPNRAVLLHAAGLIVVADKLSCGGDSSFRVVYVCVCVVDPSTL